jgi:hypothetical protein
LGFGASEDWCSDIVTIRNMTARLTDCGAKICELHFSDLLLLRFICFVDEHVAGFDIYTVVSIS